MFTDEVKVLSDHEIECPECHKKLDFRTESAEAHCIIHWGVPFRAISNIRNAGARERYSEVMRAYDAFNSGHLGNDSDVETTNDVGRLHIKEV
ncbi:MAG: hypothetical protein PHW03_09405 [Eubacteriales bacterium]|nr:hypothetical protein [Eubacteriales bacterium]